MSKSNKKAKVKTADKSFKTPEGAAPARTGRKSAAGSVPAATPAAGPAAVPAAPRPADVIADLPMDRVFPTPNNPRRLPPLSDPGIIELAASIDTPVGLVCPVLVRPNPADDGYELLAGGRRYLAHQLLQRPTIRAIIRCLSDAEALEVTALENLHRVDLAPLEEARGIAQLLRAGRTAEEAAAVVGKSERWVYRRLALANNLAPCWVTIADTGDWPECDRKKARRSMREAGAVITLTVAHLELISRLPLETQQLVYFEAKEHPWMLESGQLSRLRDVVGRMLRNLAAAAWDLDDADLLPSAGACSSCPHRSGFQPQLFAADDGTETGDTCLSPNCWAAKVEALLCRARNQAKAKFPEGFIEVRTDCWYDPDCKLPTADRTGCSDLQIVGKKTEGATPALVARGPDAGAIVWVAGKKAGKLAKAAAGGLSLAERRHGLDLRRRKLAVDKLIDAMQDTPCLDPMSAGRILCVLAAFGLKRNESWRNREPWKTAGLDADAESLSPAIDALWADLRPVFVARLHIETLADVEDEDGKKGRPTAWGEAGRIAALLDLPLDRCLIAASDELKEPKSWAKGTLLSILGEPAAGSVPAAAPAAGPAADDLAGRDLDSSCGE